MTEPVTEADVIARRYWPRRYTVVALCFCSTSVCYIDRVNISVAIIPMAEHFGWSDTERGLVLSSFFVGYLLTQILGGWLANRLGGKLVLGFAVVWWSLFTLLTPPAAFISMTALLIARLLMGAGEGLAFPATYNILSRWAPAEETARAASLNLSGVPIGTITAITITPWIVTAFGWPSVFYIFASAGFVWLFFWWRAVTDHPDDHPTISESEKALIRESVPPRKEKPQIPWGALLSKPAVWALIVSHFANNWGFYVLLTWLPSYFAGALDVNLRAMWIYVAPPWIVMFIMGNTAGWLADALCKRGLSKTVVRKTMQGIAFGVPAASLVILAQITSAPLAVLVLCVALGFQSFGFAGFGTNHLDIAPRYADILFGLSNTAATIPGIIAVALTGWLVETTGSYASAFMVAAGVYGIGLVTFLAFGTGKKIID